ncbi:Com family DNA-binding transcriptional regulator [Rhizobium sp. CFBP 8762]|uniref:Com family DNA-binding transcriptional regulator n=1 Tax=Rhizobium sp. CFBP 8762 TaxID=2775279 RepID=UPI0017873FE3|nr:Com family DNA-binding transcriptional regulator [Rhizobium sp. CFBP 8762]
MKNIRCGSCSALLFKAGHGAIANDIEIKCRRCGTFNHLRPLPAQDTEPLTDCHEQPQRKHSCGSTSR